MSIFTANEYDKLVYEKELKDFLPDKMLDAHVHISKNGLTLYRPPKKPVPKDWTALVSCEMSVEDFVEVGKEMFPRQQMSALIFGMTHTKVDEANEYVIGSNRDYGFPMLCRSDYVTPADELEAKVKAGGFLGLKPYLSNRPPYIPIQETRIYDYLPQHHLEVANKNGWIVMLHIPRSARLRDPVNLAQIMEIEHKYPNVKLVVAHVGRAYAREDFGDAFEVLKETKNMYFDFTANLLDDAITEGIKTVGVDRFIYGTDLPIALMRMRRIVENGVYYNVVPEGYYGDVSGIANMREEKSDEITIMVYEQLRAFKRSAAALHLSDTDVEKILYSNAKKLIDSVK